MRLLYLPGQMLTLETAFYVFRTIICPSNDIRMYELNGHVVVCIAMKGSYIGRLYIDPIEWRKGCGRHFIWLAKELSPSGLMLHMHQENHAVRTLYESERFRAVRFGVSSPPESAPNVVSH